jgi:2-methylcitrate dehydratase PrpD
LKENQINSSQIKKIRVRTYKIAVESAIEHINSRRDAYFNIPYAIAARVVLGKNDWDAFDEKHFNDERLTQVMKKITVNVDPEIENRYPSQRGSLVEVDIGKGSPLSGKVSYPLGEPEDPLPFSITREKFREAAGAFLPKKTMNRLEGILDVSGLTDPVETLLEALSENVYSEES